MPPNPPASGQNAEFRASMLEKACDFVLHKTFEGLTVSTKSDGARLDRLVLPTNQAKIFADILAAARNHDKVMIEWGFGQRLVTCPPRRIQFRITFENPGIDERERLWRTLMSPKTLVQPPIDYQKLARSYELSGGHIKNAILNAAYRACAENRGMAERDLANAAADECAKQGLLVHRE